MAKRTCPHALTSTDIAASKSTRAHPRMHFGCCHSFFQGHLRIHISAWTCPHADACTPLSASTLPGRAQPRRDTAASASTHTHPAQTPPHEHPPTNVSASALSSHTHPCLPLSVCTYSPAHASWHVSPRTDRAACIGQQ
ncbi:hypothetical protein K438DRAFT_1888285 [Mycena galopus ATCC 62051]|nr:hypothetical protein K438DRAFT_1888285 [Mycena galopus ATCC 62051]